MLFILVPAWGWRRRVLEGFLGEKWVSENRTLCIGLQTHVFLCKMGPCALFLVRQGPREETRLMPGQAGGTEELSCLLNPPHGVETEIRTTSQAGACSQGLNWTQSCRPRLWGAQDSQGSGASLRISMLERALQTTHTPSLRNGCLEKEGGPHSVGPRARPGAPPPKCPNLLHVRKIPQNTACGAKRFLRRLGKAAGQLPRGGQSA